MGCPCNSRAFPPRRADGTPSPVVVKDLRGRRSLFGTPAVVSLEEAFKHFSKLGKTSSDGTQMTLSQADRWLKQAGVTDGRRITTTDTGNSFNKVKKGGRTLQYHDFIRFLEDLAATKKVDAKSLKEKLAACAVPGLTDTTQTPEASVEELKTGQKVQHMASLWLKKLSGLVPSNVRRTLQSTFERFSDSGKDDGVEEREGIEEDVKANDRYRNVYYDKPPYFKPHQKTRF